MAVRMQQEAERSRLRGQCGGNPELASTNTDFCNTECQCRSGKVSDEGKQAHNEAKEYRSWGMPEQAKLAEAQAEQLEQAIQAATGGKAATILFSRTWIEMVNELKEKADIRGPILQYNHYLKPEFSMRMAGR
ncbi:Uncharacterised protein [Klebsiella pneumoniae]|uniref:Uncharacterized protein n=1 Tax=Klebsiella pneumoniae TaxID=573 RepID=A0A377TLR5_KLEPN|nr:Uncharacterised protein [Klebsiella pneumoniae]